MQTSTSSCAPRHLAALAIALTLAACAERDDENAWQVTTTTLPSGGVHVVNVPPAGDVEPTWMLEEELRIGSVDAPGPAQFGTVKGLAVLSDGRIAVLDGQARELRIFAADGSHLVTHGRRGRGPGEIEDAWGLMLDSEDRIWLADSRNARMSVFDAGDGLVRDHPFQLTSSSYWWNGTMTGDGQVLLPAYTVGPDSREILRVYDGEMNVLDSLPLADPRISGLADDAGTYVFEGAGGRRMFTNVPFYPPGYRVLTRAGGIWSTTRGDASYRIKHWVPGRDTTLILETRRPNAPVSAAERDSAIDRLKEAAREMGAQQADWSRIPQVKPAIGSIFLGESGRLWVGTHVPDGIAFDVYEPDGRHLATASTALNLQTSPAPVVRGEQLWAVVKDELDVEHVVRVRIVPRGTAH